MAKPKKGASAAAISPDEGNSLPRLSLAERGFVGLKTSNGKILEETQQAFRYPAFIKTINEMRNNPTVGAALNVYHFMMSRVKWCVEAPADASKVEKERAELIETMMSDMTHSWADFISTVIPCLEYGFATNEIVLYRRLKRNGSKYNDGLIGIKKLPPRSQETICKWVFSEDGNELIALKQSLVHLENAYRFQNRTDENGFITIPREKFLLFTTNGSKGNPEGRSILKPIYLAYKQLSLLQENQLIGVAKDASGLMKIEVPANYLNPNGSTDEIATAKGFQTLIDQANKGTQSGLLVPQMIDPESKMKMFDYSMLENKSVVRYNTESIIRGYQNDILTSLNVDIIKLGEAGGSYALSESKTSILAMAVQNKLKEIQNVLNQHLMRTIYEANGWDCTNMATFEFESEDDLDLDTLSSAIQRVVSVGAVEVTRELANRFHRAIGIDELPEDEPIDPDKLASNMAGKSSKSGSGMAAGTSGNGTSTIGGDSSKKDSSVSNKSNAP